jgi:hypothetical protein
MAVINLFGKYPRKKALKNALKKNYSPINFQCFF